MSSVGRNTNNSHAFFLQEEDVPKVTATKPEVSFDGLGRVVDLDIDWGARRINLVEWELTGPAERNTMRRLLCVSKL